MSTLAIEAIADAETIESHWGASYFCQELLQRRSGDVPARLLVAGCGAGHEAFAIQQLFDTDVDAVDVEDFVPAALQGKDRLRFQIASVTDLPFDDGTFDAIFYHHVIEHVDDPAGSLRELRRVMSDDGVVFIGTPNRNRLVSSVGAHEQSEWESTFKNKLMDNVTDWCDRFRGRFRNELGAHAGFTRRELDGMLSPLFARRSWVTQEYLSYKYHDHRFSHLFRLAAKPPWGEILAPSIYVFCEVGRGLHRLTMPDTDDQST